MGRLALALVLAANGAIRGEVRLNALVDGRLQARADRSGVVVYVTGFDEPAPDAHVAIHQCGKRFVPRLALIQAGQWVDFINDDFVAHNVFSPVDRLDMGRAQGGTRLPHQFRKPGIVDLYCDIHEEMRGTLIVFPNHAHAVTGPDGAFRLDNVPAGKMTVFAWQPNGPPAQQEVLVEAGKDATLTVDLTEQAAPGHFDRHGRSYSEHRGGYAADAGFNASCPDAEPPRMTAAAEASLDAGMTPATAVGNGGELDAVGGRVQLLREAADLLDKASAAKKRGDRSLAGRLFSSAATLVGPEALEDIAASFQEGAPPLVTTPLKPVPTPPAPQPAAVGSSEADQPRAKPERGSLHGELQLDGRPLTDARAVVTLTPASGAFKRPAPQQRVMEQRGRQFAPRLLVVPTGSTISFPNTDPIFHNVFSRSEVDPFDLGLYKGGFARQRTFEKEGVYRLGCNIHANMSAYVLVVSEPIYAVVEAGTFAFKSLRPGRYTLKAWSEASGEPVVQPITIKPGGNTATVSLTGGAPRPSTDKYGSPR